MATAIIYMKSGNQIKLKHVKDIKYTPAASGISSLEVIRTWYGTHLSSSFNLLVRSICLEQVEAITFSK
jgi:hypothetical protein